MSKTNDLFKKKLIKLGYESTKVEGVYEYWHTHGKMRVYLYSNNTVTVSWHPEGEKKVIHYNGYIPKTAVEVKVIVKLLRLNMNI